MINVMIKYENNKKANAGLGCKKINKKLAKLKNIHYFCETKQTDPLI